MTRPFDPHLVLSLPLMANLATMSEEGPRNAPVWFLWEKGALWIPGSVHGSSVRRLARDPRCAVEIVHYDNAAGVLAHLGIRGRANVVPMEKDRFRRMLAKYLGPDQAAWNPWFVETVARIDDPAGRRPSLWIRSGPTRAWRAATP